MHAAAVIKAYKKNDVELANTVYSGVPSHVFGMEQVIDIGPMSGKSNVHFWLERHGVLASERRGGEDLCSGESERSHAERVGNPGVRGEFRGWGRVEVQANPAGTWEGSSLSYESGD